jgi:hypothetical protein
MPLDALAPDQRAVVQLVLQRGRSYAEIAELLKISEDAVRARAHAGLSALAPDVELPVDKVAQVSDYLLNQQNGRPRQATRRLLRQSNGARAWATAVRAELEDVAGSLPEIPAPAAAASGKGPAAAEDAPSREKPAAAEPPSREKPAAAEPPFGGERAAAEPASKEEAGPSVAEPAGSEGMPAPRPRPLRDAARRPVPVGEGAAAAASSRLGGAVLIGGVVLALVALLLWIFVFTGDEEEPAGAGASPTATPAATPQAVGQIELKGPGGSRARGLMRLFASQGQLAFTIEGANVPKSREKEAYAVWFVNPGGRAQRLGYAPPVTETGQLGTTGPREEDLDKFPDWLARYRQVVVSRDRSQSAERPGPVVLRGTLPRGTR